MLVGKKRYKCYIVDDILKSVWYNCEVIDSRNVLGVLRKVMKNELFSFWILTYLKFDGVYATLDSLFQQDYPEIELIISDDGSPNYYDEIEKIKEYEEQR